MDLSLIGAPGSRYLSPTSTEERPTPISSEGIEIRAHELSVHHGFPANSEMYRHGWSSWSSTSWWHLDREPWRVWRNPDRTATAEDAETDTAELHRSYHVTALSSGGECLLVGSLGTRSAVLDVDVDTISARPIDALSKSSSHSENPGETRWFLAIGDEQQCFDSYRRRLSTATSTVRSSKHPAQPTWSSWYSWFEEITEQIIIDEAAAAAGLGYRVLQIDDGWEEAVGHWEANEKFPGGMRHIADVIEQQGLVPGLWVSPLIAMANTPIVDTHPEFFIHDHKGELKPVGFNWGENYYGLDCTHPGAQEWLHETITTITGWGFAHLKLDFLYAGAFAGKRFADVSREEAYRTGLEIIRDAAPDSYLLGSGAVVAPSIDLLDGIRGGPDTAPYWDNTDRYRDPTGPGVRNALRTTVNRYWLTSLLDIDPDVALVRTHGSLLSEEVNEVTLDCARVCGVFNCSDPAAWLTEPQLALLRRVTAEFVDGADHEVVQLGRYLFRINGREVDFEPWINPKGRISDRLLVK